jgi:hypothetical protein
MAIGWADMELECEGSGGWRLDAAGCRFDLQVIFHLGVRFLIWIFGEGLWLRILLRWGDDGYGDTGERVEDGHFGFWKG